jgi:hypothetical protein
MSRSSTVSIATGYGLDNQGVGFRVPVRSRIFTSPYCPDWLWGTPTFQSNEDSFPGGKVMGAKLNAHLQLEPRSRKCVSINPLPIRLVACLSTHTALSYLTFDLFQVLLLTYSYI